MSKEQALIRFFLLRPALSVAKIEREAGLPATLLAHVLAGRKKLPEKHRNNLLVVLKKYGYIQTIISSTQSGEEGSIP